MIAPQTGFIPLNMAAFIIPVNTGFIPSPRKTPMTAYFYLPLHLITRTYRPTVMIPVGIIMAIQATRLILAGLIFIK